MTDLTVLIPVRIDSVVRLENIIAVVKYLMSSFDAHVIVIEADKYNNHILKAVLPKKVFCYFVDDCDPVFYRTRLINDFARNVTSRYIAIWDADVVVPAVQVQKSLEMLRQGVCDIVYPYDGTFLDTSEIIRQIYIEANDIGILQELQGMMCAPYGTKMRGGAFIANTDIYRAAGMENERFYGWGPEDWERVERWKNLGYRIKTVDGVLFHLSHPRDMNGMHNNPEQKRYTFKEKSIIMYSSAEEIKARMGLE